MLNFLLAAMNARTEALSLALGQQSHSNSTNRELETIRRRNQDKPKNCA